MLDPQGRFTLAELPEVLLFPDDRMVEGFYAMPAAPRIALDEAGRPQIALVVYGRKKGTDFVASGGLLSLTTTLALTGDEESRLDAALRRRLAEQFPPAPGETAKVPVRLSVEWLTAEVEVRLIPDLHLAGKPSMSGANVCSFSANLNADTAGALREAWDGGLREASLSYRATVRTAPGAATTVATTASETSEEGSSGRSAYQSSTREFSVSSQQAAPPYPLELAGPLSITPQDLASRMSTLGLG